MRSLKLVCWFVVSLGLFGIGTVTPARAGVTVFECSFPENFNFIITIKDGGEATVGAGVDAGDKSKAYFDALTKAWVIVEFIDHGRIPSTLTTILPDGVAWHSRHSMFSDGRIVASQMTGQCQRL